MAGSLSAGRRGRQGEGLLLGLAPRRRRAGRLRPLAEAASKCAVLAAASMGLTGRPLPMAEAVID